MVTYDIVASIVLFKNNRTLVGNAIKSFLATSLNVKLWLLDNSPTDELRDLATDHRVEYVFNNANLGFGKAHNIGIRRTLHNTRYHLVLNPDVTFVEGTLERLLQHLDAHADVGLVMPEVLSFEGERQYLCKRLPSPYDLFSRRFLARIFGSAFRARVARYQMMDKDYTRMFESPSLSGCFMLFRSAALEKAGLFDERFFMYLEDIDITRRVHRHFKTVYFPDAHIYHGHARESYRINKLLFIHIQSAIRYFNKWGWFFDAERKRVNRTV